MKTTIVTLSVVLAIALIGGAIGYFIHQPEVPVGSVQQASEYHYTTLLATTTVRDLTLKSGAGTLGSIIISVLGTGNAVLYDATTSYSGLRALATTSLNVLGVIGASQAAGTYTYDTTFVDGLLISMNGAQASTTITWR
jgi:hypothetical protein